MVRIMLIIGGRYLILILASVELVAEHGAISPLEVLVADLHPEDAKVETKVAT